MANETKTEKKAENELKKIQDQKAKKEKKAAKALEAREKRKASIEKSNERQAAKEKKRRNMTKGQKARRILIPLCAVLLALALALCGFFGVFDRAIAAEKTADGDRISVAEYEYYNRMYFNYYYQMSQQYEQYYGSYYGTGAGKMMTGYDYTKTPADQEFVPNEEAGLTIDKKYGDKPTWADYFEQEALKEANSSTMLYKKALAEGYELTKSEQKELDEFVESLQKNADDDSYSLDAYLRTNYGRGMSPSLLKKIYTKQTIVNRYKEDKQKELAKDITDDEIEKEFNENAKDYTTVDIRNFTVNNTISADDKASKDDIKKANAEADAKKEAENFKAQPQKATIQYDDFEKLDLRVGTILECNKVPKADKLLQFKIDDGMGGRTIVSGIAQWYKPEELVGTQVIFVANLAPRKLKGIESQGMLLTSQDADGRINLLRPEIKVKSGVKIS